MIEVMFDCKVCGLQHEKVMVPARDDPEAMDVVTWTETVVMPRVMRAHALRSLMCEGKECDLYLPFPEQAEWVGQQCENLPVEEDGNA